jgi:hypothetical protein
VGFLRKLVKMAQKRSRSGQKWGKVGQKAGKMAENATFLACGMGGLGALGEYFRNLRLVLTSWGFGGM